MVTVKAEQVKEAARQAAADWERLLWREFLGGGPKLRPQKSALSTQARKMLPAFVRAGFRALALKCHPDKKGGSEKKMIALIELKKWLEAL